MTSPPRTIDDLELVDLCDSPAAAGWKVAYNHLFDVEPSEADSILPKRGRTVWTTCFEERITWCRNAAGSFGVEVGWTSACDPNGEFILKVVRRTLDAQVPDGFDYDYCRPVERLYTRSLAELRGALRQAFQKYQNVDRDAAWEGDFETEPPRTIDDLVVFGLPGSRGWNVVRNQLFEIDPAEADTILPRRGSTVWDACFREGLVWCTNADGSHGVDVGWMPVCDPKGRFVLQVVRRSSEQHPSAGFNLYDRRSPLETFEARSLAALVEAIRAALNKYRDAT